MTTNCLTENGDSGFSLIEVMIAIMVFAVGALAVATMQGTSINGNSLGRQYTEATTLAMTELETLSALPWPNTLLTDTDGNDVAGLGYGIDTEAGNDPDHKTVDGVYTIFWNVADNEFVNDTKTVAMYVTWQEKGKTRSVRMRYIIPKRV